MRTKIVWAANIVVIVMTGAFILAFLTYGSRVAIARENLPGPLAATGSTKALAFATFSGNSYTVYEVGKDLVDEVFSAGESGQMLQIDEPLTLSVQEPPPSCEADQLIASPDGRFLATQYLCHANTAFQLTNNTNSGQTPLIYPRSYFLNWSPDGAWLLFREIDHDQIWLVSVDGQERLLLDLPVGTYGAAFAPDGRQIVYTASWGLGFGSEMGFLDLAIGVHTVWQTEPHHIFAFPTWSRSGEHIAYILMADSNIPFTTGELWLAVPAEQSATLLAQQVDAGRGFPPAWTPDSQFISFIQRENPASLRADNSFHDLHSNIYQVEIANGEKLQLTYFDQSMVYDIAWSPDGRQLAFTAQDAIWVVEPGEAPIQVNLPGTAARHPVWLVDPVTSE